MTLQEFYHGFSQLLRFGAVYYTRQFLRCVMLSFAVFALAMLARKTIWKDNAFLKAGLWGLFLPLLFAGKMKIFDGKSTFGGLFFLCDSICMAYVWICYLYFAGIFICTLLMLFKRIKLKKMIAKMEQKNIDGTVVYLTEMSVSPFTFGVFHPKIILPRVMFETYSDEEIRLILLHEKVHIRLGHLWFFLFWDVLRILLWINPLFHFGAKFFREDMEDICDRVTIQAGRESGYAYGKLLLKSICILKADQRDMAVSPHYIEDKEYQGVRKRIEKIADYKPYKRSLAIFFTALYLCSLAGIFAGIGKISHGRYTPNESIVIYDMETEQVLVEDGEEVRKEISFDEDYIYVKEEFLQELVKNSGTNMEYICIYCGGYHKLPGIGGGGGFSYVTMDDLQDGVYRMEYKEDKDVFGTILKYM